MYWTVLADTHGNRDAIYRIIEAEDKTAGFIHLGDLAADMELVSHMTAAPLLAVAGNCDCDSPLPGEIITQMGDDRILLTHGHLYQVKGGLERLAKHALSRHCSVALFGHTHKALIEQRGPLLLVNPGALQRGSAAPSYARIHLTDHGLRAELVMA